MSDCHGWPPVGPVTVLSKLLSDLSALGADARSSLCLRRVLAVVGLPLWLLCACAPSATHPDIHYVLGKPYQAAGIWHYPTETYDLVETGLASVLPDNRPARTTDGEIFDQGALAAAHPTVQLPAIARLTNLETGRSIVLRINDRGTGDPARLIEVTKRVATLLGMRPSGTTQVRLQLLVNESHAAADSLPGAPKLALAAAPVEPVVATDLSTGSVAKPAATTPMSSSTVNSSSGQAEAVNLTRLPETVTQGPPQPGRLWVRLDTFQEYRYAAIQRSKLIQLSPVIVSFRSGRLGEYRVQIGPLQSVEAAETVLGQALAAGVPDARIVVE
jgi:rare lipoprotein A